MLPYHSLRLNYQHGLEDRGEPTIELNEELAVLELDTTTHLPMPHNQLLPERSIFCFQVGSWT